MPTIYYNQGNAHTGSTSIGGAAATDHYHSFVVSDINNWIKGSTGVPSNAKITKVEVEVETYISSSGNPQVDLSLFLGPGEDEGTNLGSKGNVSKSSTMYKWDITSYFKGDGHETYPFSMNTSQPRLVPYWTVNYILSFKVYCPTVRLAVTYDEYYTISTMVSPEGAGTITGAGTYKEGSTITLTAIAGDAYIFKNWNDGVTNNSRTITVTGDATYTAVFKVNKIYIGTAKPKAIYIGTQEVKAIYIGTTKVYG